MTTTSSFMSTFTALGVWLALRTCALLMSSSFGWGVGAQDTTNTVAEADIAALSPPPGDPDGPGRRHPRGHFSRRRAARKSRAPARASEWARIGSNHRPPAGKVDPDTEQ